MIERALLERLGQPALPESYRVDRVAGTAVSPRKVAWHWELTGPARGLVDARQKGRMVLRLVPAAAASPPRDLAVLEGASGRGYAEVAPGRTVLLRLLWLSEDGGERLLAESDVIRVPWERPDDLVAPGDGVRTTGAGLRPVSVDSPRGVPPWGGADR